MPKAVILAIALTAAMLACNRPAHAATMAWCAVLPIGEGSVTERCLYPDFESCQREASGGNRGFCRPSGYVLDQPAPRKRRQSTRQ